MKLIGIAIKRSKRAPMEILNEAEVTTEAGITGDFRGSIVAARQRQVTVLSTEQWQDACRQVGVKVPWEARRSNLLIEGHRFGPGDIGKRLCIGTEVELEVTGETFPCSRMDEAREGLKDALNIEWRGGVTCKVILGGDIKMEDMVFWNK